MNGGMEPLKTLVANLKSPQHRGATRRAFRKIYATTSKEKTLAILTRLFDRTSPPAMKGALLKNTYVIAFRERMANRLANEPSLKTIRMYSQEFARRRGKGGAREIARILKKIYPARNIKGKMNMIEKADHNSCRRHERPHG